MKRALLFAALISAFFSVSNVSAQDYPCTTGDGNCGGCKLDSDRKNLRCDFYGARVAIAIDNCVGNDNGQMVHGLGAGDSCTDYQLADDTLSAECRAINGSVVPTFISIPDFFVARQGIPYNVGNPILGDDFIFLDGIVCAQ